MAAVQTKRSTREKRKAKRKPLHYRAWVVPAPKDSPQQCMLADFSQTGARICRPQEFEIPDRFLLLLTSNGRFGRRCRVVWRSPSHIGVQFFRPD
jgi:PilZ domain-containing protein